MTPNQTEHRVTRVLLALSGSLPFVREVGIGTGRERAFASGDLERALRALSNQFQLQLQQAAEARQVKHSFRTLQARLDALLAEVTAADVLIVGSSGTVHAAHARPSHLYLLYEGGESGRRGLALTAQLTGNGYRGATLLTETVLPQDVVAGAANWLQMHGRLPVDALQADTFTFDTLVAALAGRPRGLLLLPRGCRLLQDPLALSRIVKRLGMPVLLYG
ncbi:MAG: hypothetical protein P8Y64_14340 [Gammaproteobacteria bacterium]